MPYGPAELRIPNLDNTPSGSWGTIEHLPLLGMRRRGNTCYVLSVSQVLLRVPAVVEWARQHHSQGCASQRTSCVICSLCGTYQELLEWAETRRVDEPSLVKERARVGRQFLGNRQHDVFEFFDKFLACARRAEIAAGRSNVWRGVQVDMPVATHVDRLFGFVEEVRRRCTRCQRQVRVWFESARVLHLSPLELPGGPATVSEMYLAACGPGTADAPRDEEVVCESPECRCTTWHTTQRRIVAAPNILVIRVRRDVGPRLRVAVEEELDLPGLPGMELVGVVYHNGETRASGHYTCVCRGPRGRYFFFDDSMPVHRIEQEVAHVKPRQAYMIV